MKPVNCVLYHIIFDFRILFKWNVILPQVLCPNVTYFILRFPLLPLSSYFHGKLTATYLHEKENMVETLALKKGKKIRRRKNENKPISLRYELYFYQ